MGATSSKQKGRSALKYDTADRPSSPGKPHLVPDTSKSEPDVVTIRWEPPHYDGGSKIIGYLVEHRRTGSPHWVRASPVLVHQPELTLSGLEPGWRYQFRVSAKNAIGYSDPGDLSDLLTVTFQRSAASPPYFVKELQDNVALENEKIELSVGVRGTPNPSISWYKDGLEIFSSRRHRISTENDTSTLIIHQAALSDEGEIKCTATNRVGHSATKARLQLEAPPSIRLPRQYEDGLLFEKGEVIRLKVLVAGRPEPEVSWFHNGEIVYSGGRYEISHAEKYASLRVEEARRTDRGEYHVRAVNKLTEDVASFLVTVTDRPMPPGRAKVVMTLGRSVTLSWTTPDDDGGCKIGNYIVEYYRIGWNMWLKAATCRQLTTTLGDLIEGSEYKFRVKAENPYGVSDPSDESDVIFIPDPKRGLLEPPERGGNKEDDIWFENRKGHRALPPTQNPVPDENYSTRKPKSKEENTWMEKNNLFPREDEIKKSRLKSTNDDLHENVEQIQPIKPKRKLKTERKLKEKKVCSERKKSEKSNYSMEKFMLEENQPRSAKDEEDLMYGSSEMMLVLLPNSRSHTEEREPSKREELMNHLQEERTDIAPPMSLSAPELGSGEPIIFPPLRAAVSSSELLHELAMSRVFRDLAQYETDKALKRRHSLEHRRNSDRRSSATVREMPQAGNILDLSRDDLRPSIKSLNEICEKRMEVKRLEKTDELRTQLQEGITYSIEDNFTNDFKNNSSNFPLRKLSDIRLQKLESDMSDTEGSLKEEESEEEEEEEEVEEEEEEEELDEEMEEEEIEAEADEMVDDEDDEEGEAEDEELEVKLDENEVDEARNINAMKILRREENVFEETYHPRNKIPKSITGYVPPDNEHKDNSYKANTLINKSVIGITFEDNDTIDKTKSKEISVQFANKKTHEHVRTEQNFEGNGNTAFTTNSKNLQIQKEKVKNKIYVTDSNNSSEKQELNIAFRKPNSTPNKRLTPAKSLVIPKPILKHRDRSQERADELKEKREIHIAPTDNLEPELHVVHHSNEELEETEDSLKLRKKQVRIEEPFPKKDAHNAIGKSSLSEELDPTKIVINHYSDIVAEYGKGRKSVPALYLNYDELRAAAKKAEEELTDVMFESSEPAIKNTSLTQLVNGSFDSTSSSQTDEANDVIGNEQFLNTKFESQRKTSVPNYTERKVRSIVDFSTDLTMFLVACWLYVFKDERLAIPVLCLMVYRQLHEAIMRKIPERWRRK